MPMHHVAGTHVAPASWPSGHATAATVLALCALLVAPRRVRPAVAAIGGLYTLAVGCSLLILAWHMPSDVIGGYLLGALWVAVAVAVLRCPRFCPRGVRSRLPPRRVSPPSAPRAPGSQRGSELCSLAARARMNSRSDSRLR